MQQQLNFKYESWKFIGSLEFAFLWLNKQHFV